MNDFAGALAGARPAPFSPGHFTVPDRPADFGVEVGDPREHGLPIGAHVRSPDEGPARMRRLLAAVVLVEETSRGIEIMFVHGHDQPVNHFGHLIPPGLVGHCTGARRRGPRPCAGSPAPDGRGHGTCIVSRAVSAPSAHRLPLAPRLGRVPSPGRNRPPADRRSGFCPCRSVSMGAARLSCGRP